MNLYNICLYNTIPKSLFLCMNNNHTSNKYFLNMRVFSNTVFFFWSFSETQAKFFIDLLIVDYPTFKLRYLSVYNIFSLLYNVRFLFKIYLDNNLAITSVTTCYPSACWFERECWDMFGIFYYNNLDLRRILNDYGFDGHPLRKDFPLSGYSEIVFYLYFNLVFYDSIKMNQEYRFFYTTSPWKIFI